MLMKDNKRSITTIISGLGAPEQEAKPDNVEQDASIGLDTAAEEILKAVESKSPKALVEALKSFMEMCDYEEADSDEAKE